MPPKEKPPKNVPPVSKDAKPPDRKASATKTAAQSGSAAKGPPEQKASETKPGVASSSAETKAPDQKTSDEKPGAEPGATETKAADGVTGEPVNTEMKRIDGEGMASDLTLLRGMNNPFEIVKWTYMSPALEKERDHKEIHTEVFWAAGKAAKERDLQREKELAKLMLPKPGDPDYCVLKYGNIPSPRPHYCTEHGWISGPASTDPPPEPELSEKILKCLEINRIESRRLGDCHSHGELKVNIFVEKSWKHLTSGISGKIL